MRENNNLDILVAGCGGLGSEVIKLLRNIECNLTVLDYDTIETSNLNRQFFFLKNERSRFKSEVIGEKLRCKYIIEHINNLKTSFLDKFDIIFCCLDNVSSRMQLNYLFFHSKCGKLIDCGVEGFKAHVKRVSKNESCLYCIKDLYNVDKMPYICSLKNIKNQEVTEENRDLILKSMIFQAKELNDNQFESHEENNVEKIVSEFNSVVSDELKTSYFEVEGIHKELMANVCTINSICASLSLALAFDDCKENFIFVDCTGHFLLTRIEIEKDTSCFVCNGYSDEN